MQAELKRELSSNIHAIKTEYPTPVSWCYYFFHKFTEMHNRQGFLQFFPTLPECYF